MRTGQNHRRVLAGLVLALLFAPLGCTQKRTAATPPPRNEKQMSVKFEAKPQKKRWLPGERILVDLQIENRGSTVFEAPDPDYPTSTQPQFELTGPRGAKLTFNPSARLRPGAETQTETPKIRVAPGETWSTVLSITPLAKIDKPGPYSLRAWIDQEGTGMRIESPSAEFVLNAPHTTALSADLSRGPANVILNRAVELLEDGSVATANLFESDARNAELEPFERNELGQTWEGSTSIHGVFANFELGLAKTHWIVTSKDNRLLVGNHLLAKPQAALGGVRLKFIPQPVATHDALFVAGGMPDGSVAISRATAAPSTGIQRIEAPVTVVPASGSGPVSGAMTVTSQELGSRIVLALSWDRQDSTSIQLLTIDSGSLRVLARNELTVPHVRPLPDAIGAGACLDGSIRASLLVRAADKATRVQLLEVRGAANLEKFEAPALSDVIVLQSPLRDVQVHYFETHAGSMSRMAVLRDSDSTVLVIGMNGQARKPHSPVPGSGPLTMLPGGTYWYAVWPGDQGLDIGPL
jgi:hypothetical protein